MNRNAPACCSQVSAPARTAASAAGPGRSRFAGLTKYGVCGCGHAGPLTLKAPVLPESTVATATVAASTAKTGRTAGCLMDPPPPPRRDFASNHVQCQAGSRNPIRAVQPDQALSAQVGHEYAAGIALQEEGCPLARSERRLIGDVKRELADRAALDLDVDRGRPLALTRLGDGHAE